ncbi:MAG: type II secretion system F family protein [Thermoguttaceae bacterium]|jgi:tight adherence protein C
MAEVALSSVPWWSALMSGWAGPCGLCIVAGLAFFLIARTLVRTPTREELRLEQIRSQSTSEQEHAPEVFGPWTHALAAQIPESEKERAEFELLLRQAGIYTPRAPETIYALRFLLLTAPLLLAGVCAIFADASRTVPILVTGALISIALAVLPRVYVFFRRRRRMRRIREALPDTLDMLGMCVSGGLELGESLDHVARRLTRYPECAQELMLLKRHAELGSLRRALGDFAQRVDLPEANQLAGLLLRGSHLGTELVGSLAQQAEHLRVARRQAAAVRANKTPVKMIFPIMFCFAPAALILLTGPAVVQLRDFLTGRAAEGRLHLDTSAARAEMPPGTRFSPQAIVDALDELDQSRLRSAQAGNERTP